MLSRERRAAKQLMSLVPRVSQLREALMLLINAVDVTGHAAISVVVQVALNVQAKKKMAKMEKTKVTDNKEANQEVKTNLVKDVSVVDLVVDMVEAALAVEIIVVVSQSVMELHQRMMEQPANQKESALVMVKANHHAHLAEEDSDEVVVASVEAQDAHVHQVTDPEVRVVVMILKNFFHTSHSKFSFIQN